MKDILFSGCSYSSHTGNTPFPEILNRLDGINIIQTSWPGQSNDSIIRNIKNSIKIDKRTDTTFVCQLTHLHRLSMFCTLNQKWVDFQPEFINVMPEVKDNTIIFDVDFENVGVNSHSLLDYVTTDLIKFYKTYLKYLYDETHSFYKLMNDIDDLTDLVNSTNNKIVYMFWPHTIPDVSELENRNFLNIDGEYSLLTWSTKNNLLDGRNSHLGVDGHIELSNILKNYLNLNSLSKKLI
jgi:hypothetical protein